MKVDKLNQLLEWFIKHEKNKDGVIYTYHDDESHRVVEFVVPNKSIDKLFNDYIEYSETFTPDELITALGKPNTIPSLWVFNLVYQEKSSEIKIYPRSKEAGSRHITYGFRFQRRKDKTPTALQFSILKRFIAYSNFEKHKKPEIELPKNVKPKIEID